MPASPGSRRPAVADEVRVALREGRLGLNPPGGLRISHLERQRSLFAWTPDGQRCYALRQTERFFWVATTMRAVP